MSWNAVRVRPATTEDLPAVLDLADDLREQLGPSVDRKRGRGTPASSRAALAAHFSDALAHPDRHLVVAVADDDVPLGMALFAVAPAHPLLDAPALHVSHVVADRNKRRGAGKALVGAATTYAEEHGLEQVVVSVHPGSRDANRFFARLGFAPLAVRRIAPTAVVRRRLQASDAPPIEHVVRRRTRRLGRLPVSAAALPLGRAEPDR